MTASESYRVDTPAIIDTAIRAAGPQIVKAPAEDDDEGTRAAVFTLPEGATVHTVDVEALVEKYRDRPRRKKGTVVVHDAPSFVAYFGKHALTQTEVWADAVKCRIVGVINANMGTSGDGVEDYAGWSDHRVTYGVDFTPAWKAWTENDGRLLSQVEMAELIEARAIDVVTPSSAEMLELVQTFQQTANVEFESSQRLSSGETQLVYKETLAARAGHSGDMEIPSTFTLVVRPFEGAEAQQVQARLRTRIINKQLRIGYLLERPEDVVREAFESVINSVASQIDVPVFRGTPAA